MRELPAAPLPPTAVWEGGASGQEPAAAARDHRHHAAVLQAVRQVSRQSFL